MENDTLLLDLSEDELIAKWKTLLHMTPVRRDCAVEYDDGVDLDDVLRMRLRLWYARLLLMAPVEWLPVEDLTAEVSLGFDSCGRVTVDLPPRCVRLVEWQLDGWKQSVTKFAPQGSLEAAVSINRWTMAGLYEPAAICYDNRVMLIPTPETDPIRLLRARCVVKPQHNRYVLHCAALHQLPDIAGI